MTTTSSPASEVCGGGSSNNVDASAALGGALDEEAETILFSVAGDGGLPRECGALGPRYQNSEAASEPPYWATWGF